MGNFDTFPVGNLPYRLARPGLDGLAVEIECDPLAHSLNSPLTKSALDASGLV